MKVHGFDVYHSVKVFIGAYEKGPGVDWPVGQIGRGTRDRMLKGSGCVLDKNFNQPWNVSF